MTLLETTEYKGLVDQLLQVGDAHDPRSKVIELLGEIANVWPDSVRADDQAGRLVESATALIDLQSHKFAPQDQDAAMAAIDELLAYLPPETMAAVMDASRLTPEETKELGKMDHNVFIDGDAT